MPLDFQPATGALADLEFLRIETADAIAHVRLHRPEKRNAISDEMIAEVQRAMLAMPSTVKAIVLSGEGQQFCAGLDLSSISEHSVAEGIFHSRTWHAAMDTIQFGRAPVVAVLHGAVVGGGLELAASAHVRVAEASTFYALPEGQRGIFVGGGGSARVPRLIGVSCMTDMMLCGRVFDAEEGHRRGLSQYLVPDGAGLEKGFELAAKIASNAPLSNFAITQALPRIADLSQPDGLFVESLMAAIAQGDEIAKARVRDFLEKRAAKVEKG